MGILPVTQAGSLYSSFRFPFLVSPLFTDPFELCRVLELPETVARDAWAAHAEYPLEVPEAFVAKMEKGNPRDPLLLQILPQPNELRVVEGFSDDPLRECNAETGSCPLLQKYVGRTLLIATDRCMVHCRYCFRQKTKNRMSEEGGSGIRTALSKIAHLPPEVILSGGDPLRLGDDELTELLDSIRSRPEVRRVRIHTRAPVVAPKRLTTRLLSKLRSDDQTVFSMVLHINHPREIDAEFAAAITETVDRGIPVFVQSVLLRGVNDDFAALFGLYDRSISLRMIPYYLHQLDRVSGAAHFEVEADRGLELISRLRNSLPGYAVPRYVREVPGEGCKTEIRFPPPEREA